MVVARNKLVSLADTKYYHCISRCVRRAFLCGVDNYTGKSYEHRKTWIEGKIFQLAQVFCIDICAYAIMSNHMHLVLHVNDLKVKNLSDEEILIRWHSLFQGTKLTKKYFKNEKLTEIESITISKTVSEYRSRLCSLSWFMRVLNQDISRRANEEDFCTGRFWEGRFKSQALLDEAALAACMAYVDLNPIRAKMAKTPEESDHTSIKKRIDAKRERNAAVFLQPFANEKNNAKKEEIENLPFDFESYVELVQITSHCLHNKKKGLVKSAQPILENLNISPKNWINLTTDFTRIFHGAVGGEKALNKYYQHLGIGQQTAVSQSKRFLC